MTASPGLVIFDCDGVLVDSEPIAMRILLETLAEEGLRLDPETGYDRLVGLSLADMRALLLDEFGLVLSDAALATMRQRLFGAFRAELRPTPGVVEALATLPARYCVASSSQKERIDLSLEAAGLAPGFLGPVFSATDVSRGKPAPDLFLHAAASMGVAPRDCLVVEDSPTGIRAAKDAGMHVVAFLGGGHAGRPGWRARILDLEPERLIVDMRDLFDAD